MLDEIVSVSSYDDLLNVATEFAESSNRAKLCKELTSNDIILQEEDLMSDSELDEIIQEIRLYSGDGWVEKLNSGTKAKKVLNTLQLISKCNAGIKRRVEGFLEKVCL